MKIIYLSSGNSALIDDEDYERVIEHTWTNHGGYVINVQTRTMLHRFILRLTPNDPIVEHKNDDGYDNQKHNLIVSNSSMNGFNRSSPTNNTSGYKGVSLHKKTKKWKAEYRYQGKLTYLGLFNTPKDAAVAYNNAIFKRFSFSIRHYNSIPELGWVLEGPLDITIDRDYDT